MLGKFFGKGEPGRASAAAADAAAVAQAVAHFEATRGEVAHRRHCRVIARDVRGAVVRVCHGSRTPPDRVWLRVPDGKEPVAEVMWDEAARYGEQPWR